MSLRTVFKTPVAEATTAQYKGQLVDETGANIAKASLVALTLSIINIADDSIINQMSQVDILDKSRGAVSATGMVTITLEVADNVVVDSSKQLEAHLLFIEWTYGNNGSKAGNHEVEFQVYNRGLLPIPTPPGP